MDIKSITVAAMPNVQSSATATGGGLSNEMMILKFHGSVKTGGAVAVGCSDLLGGVSCLFRRRLPISSKFPPISMAMAGG